MLPVITEVSDSGTYYIVATNCIKQRVFINQSTGVITFTSESNHGLIHPNKNPIFRIEGEDEDFLVLVLHYGENQKVEIGFLRATTYPGYDKVRGWSDEVNEFLKGKHILVDKTNRLFHGQDPGFRRSLEILRAYLKQPHSIQVIVAVCIELLDNSDTPEDEAAATLAIIFDALRSPSVVGVNPHEISRLAESIPGLGDMDDGDYGHRG
jgi:hypothetical protein